MKNTFVIPTVVFNEMEGKFPVPRQMSISTINIIKTSELVK
jgi:hypothetical protein